jgi:hypothetical protein
MEPPARLTVPTCVGCGAMGIFGTCETGCSEHKLELVPGAAYDAVTDLREGAERLDSACAGIIDQLIQAEPSEQAYRALKEQAGKTLRAHAEIGVQDLEPPEVATTWWCGECGGLDAPQPCLGVCIWRPAQWAGAAAFDRERDCALAEFERAQRLRTLLRQIACTNPRPGQLARHWGALRAAAGYVRASGVAEAKAGAG